MKNFLIVHQRYNSQIQFGANAVNEGETNILFGTGSRTRTAMFLVDSDYDTEDEEYGEDELTNMD